jgi:hypothetical protein
LASFGWKRDYLPVACSTLIRLCFYSASGLLSPFPNKSRTRVEQEYIQTGRWAGGHYTTIHDKAWQMQTSVAWTIEKHHPGLYHCIIKPGRPVIRVTVCDVGTCIL